MSGYAQSSVYLVTVVIIAIILLYFYASSIALASLVPRPRGRRGKSPGIHCLRMCERFRKSSVNESDYGQVTRGCYAEK